MSKRSLGPIGPVAQWIRQRPTESGIAGSSPAGVICKHVPGASGAQAQAVVRSTLLKTFGQWHIRVRPRRPPLHMHGAQRVLRFVYFAMGTPYRYSPSGSGPRSASAIFYTRLSETNISKKTGRHGLLACAIARTNNRPTVG